MRKLFLVLAAIAVLAASCGETPNPKPRGYCRITFPEKVYATYDSLDLPYTFQMPRYCLMERETSRGAEKYWTNMVFPQLNAKVHLSFKYIEPADLDALIEDSHTMAYKHTVKAEGIEKISYADDTTRVFGLMYSIKGNVASPVQFFVTDSTRHFLRGSLYFNCSPNKDSLMPSVDFVRADIERLFETINWK
ncbi:MAG: gliding motility lipoprotein GldD [Bacteroidales bacterium]|nr:gliding motility lipoprotein GldD [Bacteroidales bacterium]